jgi:hypothetical protein
LWDLLSSEQRRQSHAFDLLIQAADSPAEWNDELWNDLFAMFVGGNDRQSSIASEVHTLFVLRRVYDQIRANHIRALAKELVRAEEAREMPKEYMTV